MTKMLLLVLILCQFLVFQQICSHGRVQQHCKNCPVLFGKQGMAQPNARAPPAMPACQLCMPSSQHSLCLCNTQHLSLGLQHNLLRPQTDLHPVIYTPESNSTKMLSDFRSLCAILCRTRWSTPSSNCKIIMLDRRLSGLLSLRYWRRVHG